MAFIVNAGAVGQRLVIPHWKKDKQWADRFMPEIKGILGLYLIGEAPYEEDATRNTDLIVLRMEAVRIGVRVRKTYYEKEYPYEFTIRTSRPSGAKTELTKMVEGWGQYFFYGFSDTAGQRLSSWCLLDMNKFRLWLNRHLFHNGGKMPGIAKSNGDKSSDFRAFNRNEIEKLHPGFIVGKLLPPKQTAGTT